ncbi:MAG TPA: DinB family protein [Roseiflexaceae bacterium]|nr:DinB family protein [Roseiflexaceae bacterium]
MNHATLLAKLRVERATFDSLLDQIDPAHMLTVGAEGAWSVRDIVVHICWYDRQVAEVVAQRTLDASPMWNLSVDERNAVMIDLSRDKTLGEVLAEARATFQQMLEEVSRLSEEDLQDPQRMGMPPEWIPGQAIAFNTYRHYRQHIPALRAWSERHPCDA